MGQRESLIKQLGQFKKNASRDIPIEKLIFFGSRARGKPKKYSDVDLIVVSKIFKDMKFYKRPAKLYDHWDIDHPVDFLCYSPEEFRRVKRLSIVVEEAVREGIEIK